MRNSRGFSLIEVLVAIAVLGVILVAVAGLMTGNLGLRRQSNQATESIQLASSYLESIKRHWSVLDNYLHNDLPPAPTDARAARHAFMLEIDCVDLHGAIVGCTSDPELKQVRVTVTDNNTGDSEMLVTQVGRPFDSQGNR